MTRTNPEPIDDAVQGPSRVTPLHVQDRPATDRDMKPITGTAAWRKLTVFQRLYYGPNNQLDGGSPKYTAADRYSAGMAYTALFDASQCAGRDSTQAFGAGSGGDGGSPNDRRMKASSQLACIHSHMGERDRRIIMKVCGDGYWPSEAIGDVCGPDYKHSITARFREATDALIDAMEAARKNPNVIIMGRKP